MIVILIRLPFSAALITVLLKRESIASIDAAATGAPKGPDKDPRNPIRVLRRSLFDFFIFFAKFFVCFFDKV